MFRMSDSGGSHKKLSNGLVALSSAAVLAVSYAIFEWTGAVYYLLAGVLVGNLWEAWRRVQRRAGQVFPTGVPVFVREVSPWRVRR